MPMSKATVSGTSDDPDPDEYAVELDDGTEVSVLEFQDTAELSSGKKIQLEQFEPIDESATLTTTLPQGTTPQVRTDIIMQTARLARDVCETNVARTYEQHVQKEAFGE